jgi:hypothetical protein
MPAGYCAYGSYDVTTASFHHTHAHTSLAQAAGVVELSVHGARAAGRRQPEAPGRPVYRYGDGPRADSVRLTG